MAKKEANDNIFITEINAIKSLISFRTKAKNYSLDYEDICRNLNVNDRIAYNKYFKYQIIKRGESYFIQNKVTGFKQNGNKYTCVVNGTENYNVSITFDKNDDKIITNATCTCKYYKTNYEYCKHIYVLLMKAKFNEFIPKFEEEYNNYVKVIDEILINATKYINNNENKYYDYQVLKIKDYIEYAKSSIEDFKFNYRNVTNYYLKLKMIVDKDYYIKQNLNKLLNDTIRNQSKSNEHTIIKDNININNEKLSFSSKKSDNINKSEYSDEQLDNLGLFKWEKEEVKKGNYDPWNFEEEETEEDDYYDEDN